MRGSVFDSLHTDKLRAKERAVALRKQGKKVRIIPGSMRTTHSLYWGVWVKAEVVSGKASGFIEVLE